MDSRSMTLMGTYLGLILALTLVSLLLPWFSVPAIILGWGVSATYLHVMPLKTWLKSRIVIEFIKIPNLYKNTMELYGTLEAIKMTGVALISKMYLDALPHLTREEDEILRAAIARVIDLPTYSFVSIMPLLAISVTYLGIGVIYIYLQRTGFYRRLLI